MGKDKLLTAAVILLLVGVVGILSTKLAGRYGGYGSRGSMMGEMMRINIPPGITLSSLPGHKSEGAKLTARVCSQCHYLPSPSMRTEKEWREIAKRMFARLSMMSGRPMMGMMNMEVPSTEEQKIITGYLVNNSMRGIDPSALPEAGSKRAKLFIRVCSQCHRLPDTARHTEEEWPGVVIRMEGHMQAMGKRVITVQERDMITGYLGRSARK